MSDEEKRRWKGPGGDKKDSGRRTTERKVIARNARTESSKRWIERQLQDPYVRKSKEEGYRSRAAYKLLEIDEEAHILKRGQRVVDLGCAPGGWIQVALLKGASEVVGIDLLPVDPIEGATIFEGDVNEPADVDKLKLNFRTVKHIKPPASRAGSPEIYVIAKGFKGGSK